MIKLNSLHIFFSSLFLLALTITIVFSIMNSHRVNAAVSPIPMPIISRGVPVFASSQLYPAIYANDNDYSTQWRGNGASGWLAYDLSSVPAINRSNVVVVWYNTDTGPYDHRVAGDLAYNLPASYTVEANPAAGGPVPTADWVTLATVSNNHFHSRQHVVNLSGYNWIRINVTAVNGSSGNNNPAFNLDIHDASQSMEDNWITFGDSITQDGLFQHDLYNGTPTFAQMINASDSAHFPIQEDGGIGYLMSADGAANISTWLAMFPGKFVTLNYGTNDANGGVAATTYYNNMRTMVDAVLAAGKTPVIPTVPWGCTSGIRTNAPLLNQQIQNLYNEYVQIVRGPDMYAYFQANQNLISGDCIHPSYPVGMAAYRREWANAMLATVYSGVTPSPIPSAIPSPSPSEPPLPSPSPTPIPSPVPSPTPIPGVISWVKGAMKSPTSAASTAAITLNNVSAGNTLVVSFNVGAGYTQAATAPMTSAGPATLNWQQAVSRINGQTQANVWYAYVPTSGNYTITGKANAVTALGMAANEYQGIRQLSPILATAGAGGSSKFPSASSSFAVPEGGLIYGSMSWDNGKRTVTPGSGFTTRQTFTNASQNQPIATQDRVLTTSATLLANWTLNSSSVWDAVTVAFSN